MADYVVKGESLAAVADAIREKTGETDALGLGEMPAKVDAVFEAGKKSEYDRFWDAFQENGNRENYYAAFYRWPQELFKPKYDIIPTGSCSNMFSYASIKNLASIIENAGIVFDASNATNVSYMFNEASALVEAPTIDATNATSIDRLFNGCSSLKKASVVFPKSKPTAYTNVFARCASLEDFTAFGEISVPLSFSDSPLLTHDSLMSIMNALKDYSGSGETYTVTLGAENLAKLSDAEKMQAVSKGWTLAGWTPPTWNEGDSCNACGTANLDAYGRCPACGYSVPKGKRICSCGGEVGEDCVCISCGKTYHASEGPECVFCGLDITEE